MTTYDYIKLQTPREVRLAKLAPGHFDDEIHVSIFNVTIPPAINTTTPSSKHLAQKALKDSLPPGWRFWESLEGQWFFEDKGSGNISWSHPKADVDCDLYTSSNVRREKLDFEALSYTWGETKDFGVVHVDQYPESRTVQVTTNLIQALRHLRYPNRHRTLWIDAISINQQDECERNACVPHMGRVYEVADRVVVWLGPQSDDSQHALSTLSYLGSQLECGRSGWRFRAPEATEPQWWDRGFPLPYDDRTWSSLTSFFNRPWFTRVWTLQEIHLGHANAIVKCGHGSISWHHLRRAIICLDKRSNIPNDLSVVVRRAQLSANSQGFKPKQLLVNGRNRQCADPRDKIYGMLSLMPEELAGKIRPQYSLSVQEVYKQAFLAYLELYKTLDLLIYCSDDDVPGCPSWVPQWHGFEPAIHYPIVSRGPLFSAVATYQAPDTLEVLGVEWKRVEQVKRTTAKESREILQELRDWEPAGLREGVYPTGERIIDAYLRLLVHGRTREIFASILPFPTLEELRDEYLTHISNPKEEGSNLRYFDLRLVRDSSFITFEKGYFGHTAAKVKPNDIVCTLLGCERPMALRPLASGGFQPIGSVRVAGLGQNVALLGPLPRQWKLKMVMDETKIVHRFINRATGETTTEDPRLEPLSLDWEKLPLETVDAKCQQYRNKVTGELTDCDPRLTPEALRKRGIKLQNFRLI